MLWKKKLQQLQMILSAMEWMNYEKMKGESRRPVLPSKNFSEPMSFDWTQSFLELENPPVGCCCWRVIYDRNYWDCLEKYLRRIPSFAL
jgi:hypothetical protein